MRCHPLLGRPRFASGALVGLLLLGSSAGMSGCCGGGDPPFTATVVDPALDPRGLFEAVVKPELLMSCSCHQVTQGTVERFLSQDSDYSAITTFQGGKFLTAIADQSPLLLKGAHAGPAFTQSQHDRILPWLQGESLVRGKAAGTATTPTVAVRTGDFYVSLESLGMDPMARLSFTLSAFRDSYRVLNMTLTAGPTAGIHVKHPRFVNFSAIAASPIANDVLADVDTTVSAGQSVTLSSSLLLGDIPAAASRLALSFEQLDKVNPSGSQVQCQNFAVFKSSVKDRLSTCASLCHGTSGSDPRWSQTSSAFDMSAALGFDDLALQALCARTLGRLNLQNLSQSVLTRQVQPAILGGTPNHPYKLDSAENDFPGYEAAIKTWSMGE